MKKQWCKGIKFEAEPLRAVSLELKRNGFNEMLKTILCDRHYSLTGPAIIQLITAECLNRHFRRVRMEVKK